MHLQEIGQGESEPQPVVFCSFSNEVCIAETRQPRSLNNQASFKKGQTPLKPPHTQYMLHPLQL